MTPLDWLAAARRVHPEPPSLPEELAEADPVQLVEAREQLIALLAAGRALKQVIDQRLAESLNGGSLRYGTYLYGVTRSGKWKVQDRQSWWEFVGEVVTKSDPVEAQMILRSLYPADAVLVTGLGRLAEASGVSEEVIKETFLDYERGEPGIAPKPESKWPAYAHRLADGEIWRGKEKRHNG